MHEVAFIGIGNMGSGMASNLIKAGYEVCVFDLDFKKCAALVAQGAQTAESVKDAVKGARYVLSMLPAGAHVVDVYRNDVFEAACSGALLIDCSTIDVKTTRALGEEARQRGFLMVDAPVSGGVGGAEAGTLAFMVGGTPEAFEKAAPLFEVMGSNHVHCGASGAGQSVKICNNLMLAIQMISVAEGFTLADKLGLDPQALFHVSSKASAQCWSLTTYCPLCGVGPKTPADNNYQPGFAAALMVKDLSLALEAARQSGVSLPFMHKALDTYARMVERGEGELDFSGVILSLQDGKTQDG